MSPREQFPERNAQIIAKRKAGMWPRQIAKEMGLGHNVVIGVCNRAGLSGPAGRLEVSRGDAHPQAKLTAEMVRELRATYDPHSRKNGARALARRFGLNDSTVLSAITGDTWAHVQQAT